MGAMLQRTALSTNIKERLDFSCALLDGDGGLVVNAPHIPVHLGALGLCVREVNSVLELGPGDTAISNHPGYGGSHLPDITLVTPVFGADGRRLGYVASRTHHAEVGGVRPGSMPPGATRLEEEGVIIAPQYLARAGQVDWPSLRRLFSGGDFPSRSVEDNIADLTAALAANHRGAKALRALADRYGVEVVRRYMLLLQEEAEAGVKRALRRLGEGVYTAREELDDGAILQVRIEVVGERARVDWTGTAAEHAGNLNATPAIARSALLYVLRLLVDEPLPLNEGMMAPLELVLPAGSLLDPDFSGEHHPAPAVVGGNVETSQRLVDTLLKALGLCAASQGTMNNLIFGNASFGYYETIGGGTGAGPGFAGAHAVHSHMTNTRITDPEILEYRYPVRVERFAIRLGSGGGGRWPGGDGIVRELVFLEEMDLSLLSQRRRAGPYGMAGGERGKPGCQWIEYPKGQQRAAGDRLSLAAIDGCRVYPGDRLILETPGGGGYGKREE
jgi:5-oxoprolinase (ATP-hydrolysing)